jgi:NAD+ synthase (glutamine-hydrolysing)
VRVALCQINVTVGAIAANVDEIVAAAGEAAAGGADVALFPEQTVGGYPAEDLLLKAHFVAECEAALLQIAQRVAIPVVVGFPEQRDGVVFNSAALIRNGAIECIYRKHRLPNYGVFDEHRHFAEGHDVEVVEIGGVRFGLTICEDVWVDDGPLAATVAAGAQVVLNLSASPYRVRRLQTRQRLLAGRAREHGIPLIYCNLIGGQDELVFDGGSIAVDATGEFIVQAPQFEAAISFVDVSTSGAIAPVVAGRSLRSMSVEQEIHAALVLGLRDYVEKNGFTNVLVALSGGIDSALVLALAVDALGSERVHALTLPSAVTSGGTLTDARVMAELLDVSLEEIAIAPLVECFEDALSGVLEGTEPDATEENLQARIRGVLVMAHSNKLGQLVLTTGNKSEVSVGYMTLYGDMAGGFAPIKDIPKTMVYRLSDWINRTAGIDRIPRSIIDRPPSAELREGQRDDDSLPPYDLLDRILELYVEQDLGVEEIVASGIDRDTVCRVARLVDVAEYKRRQAPPGITIGPKAFGRDRRLPITNGFRE